MAADAIVMLNGSKMAGFAWYCTYSAKFCDEAGNAEV